jgi:dTDP-4-dehydrorhamnose reductase
MPQAVLVPGGRGQVGSELARILSGQPDSLVHAPGSAELDVTDAEAVSDAVSTFVDAARGAGLSPVMINTAAYTGVDAAESDPERAARVNTTGAAVVAKACGTRGVPLLHVSTDYVFSGESSEPYEPDDATNPRTVYGRTKLDGERAVLESSARAWVVRTAWVYGARGANFVKTMARLESTHPELSVVDDQIGSPTWSADLAGGLLELAGRVVEQRGPRSSVLHCSNSGRTSWFEFARAVFVELGADPERVHPCTSAEFPRPAPRPAFSVLSGRAWREAGLTPLRPWRDALAAAFAEHGEALRGEV